MSEARINRISNESGTGGPTLSGITTFSGLNYFVPPKGTTAERPSNAPPGSLRFNTDSAHIEYFDGLQWLDFEAFNVEIGISTAAAPASSGTGHRAVFGGGYAPGDQNTIDYITISTRGNAIRFGDLTVKRRPGGSCSDRTRGIWMGGRQSFAAPIGLAAGNTIDFITISSTGQATDFGDTTQFAQFGNAFSNSTRGVYGGGSSRTPFVPATDGSTNVICYVTIQSLGDAQDFGDLSITYHALGACSSSTRGLFGGGYQPTTPTTILNNVDYVTISTLGNSIDFGDLTQGRAQVAACSNATRGVFCSGATSFPSGSVNTIDYVTIASTGNAVDFGDRSIIGNARELSATSSPTRAIFAGGYIINVIDSVEIASTGNAIDFGDLSQSRLGTKSCSNGHGGL